MATFPRLQAPQQLQTGDQSLAQFVPQFRADGMTAIGKGVGQLGQALFQISEEEQQANDTLGLLDAEKIMLGAESQFTEFQRAQQDQTQWLPKWQEISGAAQKQMDGLRLSNRGKMALQQSLQRWNHSKTEGVREAAYNQTMNRTETALLTRMNDFITAGSDVGIDEVVKMGKAAKVNTPEWWDAKAQQAKEGAKAKRWEIASTSAKTLIANGGTLEDAEELVMATDAPDYVKEASKTALRQVWEQTTETRENKRQAQYFGGLLNKRVDGAPAAELLADLDLQVERGLIPRDAATAQMREALKNEAGADPAAVERFITDRILPYNPKTDEMGREGYAIQRDALAMGLNPLQAQRVQAFFEGSEKRHSTAASKSEAHIIKAGRESILEAIMQDGGLRVEMTPEKDPELIKLMQQPFALEHWGIDGKTADQIRKLTGVNPAEAMRVFRDASAARAGGGTGKFAADGINAEPLATDSSKTGLSKLSPWTIEAFEKALSGKSYVAEDPAKKQEASLRAAERMGQFEDWIEAFREQNKRSPKAAEADEAIREIMAEDFDAEGWSPMQGVRNMETGAVTGGDLSGDLISRVKQLEGFAPSAMPDYKQTSIGYGTKARKGEKTITREEAERRLQEELSMHAARVDEQAAKYKVTLTQNQRDALTSFDFNTGDVERVFQLAKGDVAKLPDYMKMWRMAGGKPILTSRRAKEVAWFNTP